jgi:hypothetical protein
VFGGWGEERLRAREPAMGIDTACLVTRDFNPLQPRPVLIAAFQYSTAPGRSLCEHTWPTHISAHVQHLVWFLNGRNSVTNGVLDYQLTAFVGGL